MAGPLNLSSKIAGHREVREGREEKETLRI